MYECEICGRKVNKKIRMGGYTLCYKHMHQLHKYGKFLDNIPRTNSDLNDYVVSDGVAYFNLYNQKNEKIATFIIDVCDIKKVKYHKWRLSHGHVVTGLPSKGQQRDLSHVVLDIPKDDSVVVDHINGDPLDNTRDNLRICSQGENVLNKRFMSNNTTGFIGVSYKKDRDRYDPEIRFGYTRCHLGMTKTIEEAVYKRYIAEQLLFGEYANCEEQKRKFEFTKNLPQELKDTLYNVVIEKLKNKNLWQ